MTRLSVHNINVLGRNGWVRRMMIMRGISHEIDDDDDDDTNAVDADKDRLDRVTRIARMIGGVAAVFIRAYSLSFLVLVFTCFRWCGALDQSTAKRHINVPEKDPTSPHRAPGASPRPGLSTAPRWARPLIRGKYPLVGHCRRYGERSRKSLCQPRVWGVGKSFSSCGGCCCCAADALLDRSEMSRNSVRGGGRGILDRSAETTSYFFTRISRAHIDTSGTSWRFCGCG